MIISHSRINEEDDSDTERGEWKVQLVMQNSCISTKDFKETRTIYSASKLVETFMGTDTYVLLINFLIHSYKDFNKQ